MSVRLPVKYAIFLSDFNQTSIFSTDLSEDTQITNFIKIGPMVAELLHADGRS